MRKFRTLISAAGVGAMVALIPAPAHAASDPDLCNWIQTDETQESVPARLETGVRFNLAPGYCTQPSQAVRHAFVRDGMSYEVYWRDPVTKHTGTRWVDGPYVIRMSANGFKIRILDAAVNEAL
jgi:hypothetical protein